MLHLTNFKFDDNGPKTAVLFDVPENMNQRTSQEDYTRNTEVDYFQQI